MFERSQRQQFAALRIEKLQYSGLQTRLRADLRACKTRVRSELRPDKTRLHTDLRADKTRLRSGSTRLRPGSSSNTCTEHRRRFRAERPANSCGGKGSGSTNAGTRTCGSTRSDAGKFHTDGFVCGTVCRKDAGNDDETD